MCDTLDCPSTYKNCRHPYQPYAVCRTCLTAEQADRTKLLCTHCHSLAAQGETEHDPPPPSLPRMSFRDPLSLPDSPSHLPARLSTMTAKRAWEWVDACRGGAPARGYLPSSRSMHTPYARRLAAFAVTEVLRAASTPAHPGAQIIALHFPIIFLRRGTEIPAQIAALVTDTPPGQPEAPMRPLGDPSTAWAERIRRATAAGDIRRLGNLLDAGPDSRAVGLTEAEKWLPILFPTAPEDPGEEDQWRTKAAQQVGEAEHAGPCLTGADVARWAATHLAKAGDMGGVSARLVRALGSTDRGIYKLLATFWSLPPEKISDAEARAVAFRCNAGVLLRQDGKDKPRPISSPMLPRRASAARDVKRARDVAAKFCETRGHVGLSRPGAKLAYSLVARLCAKMGGTIVTADLESSYQNLSKKALLESSTHLLDSEEARGNPSSASAYARACDRFLFAHAGLPRTTTIFQQFGRVAHSVALSQGCALATTAESVTLASCQPLRPHPYVIAKGCHDDLVICAYPGADIKSLEPPLSTHGARYNDKKSVAVGLRSAEAVTRKAAAHSRDHTAVFGCPVGDTEAWARDVWLPRFETRLQRLRRAYQLHPEAAVQAAFLLKGPGSMAMHWLRVTPATPQILETLRRADEAWTDTWLFMSGNRSAALHPDISRDDLRARIYGKGPACLGHISAEDVAEHLYARGLADAWPHVARWFTEAGMNWRDAATAAGIPPNEVQRVGATPGSLAAWLAAQATKQEDDYANQQERIGARVTSGEGPGARCSRSAREAGRPNMWIEAMSPVRGDDAPMTEVGEIGPAILVCRALGLPIWDALRIKEPSHCRRCFAAPANAQAGGSRMGSGSVLDAYGEHSLSCRRGGIAGGSKRRHDTIVNSLVRVSNAAGVEAKAHDGPVFDIGQQRRPADWLQHCAAAPGGMCCDLTVGCRSVETVERREETKVKKYAAQMARHPHLKFRAFAIDLSGEIGPDAWRTMQEWIASLGAQRAREGLPVGDIRGDVVGPVARGFTRAVVAQVAAWASGVG